MNFFYIFTPAKVVIYQFINSSDLAGFCFLTHRFATRLRFRSSQLFNFEVCVSSVHATLCNDFIRFFCLIFQNGIEHFDRFT